jgi:hypothetical protein
MRRFAASLWQRWSAYRSRLAAATKPGSHQSVTGLLVRVGGPAPGSSVPLSGTVVARNAADGQFTTTTGKNGRFQLSSPPGLYRLTGHSPSHERWPEGVALRCADNTRDQAHPGAQTSGSLARSRRTHPSHSPLPTDRTAADPDRQLGHLTDDDLRPRTLAHWLDRLHWSTDHRVVPATCPMRRSVRDSHSRSRTGQAAFRPGFMRVKPISELP